MSGRTLAFALVVSALSLAAAGCGGDGTVRVSGKVTFDGKPVPKGKIYFVPDGSKGNKGAAGFATITDGAYDTGATDGHGVSPGAVTVTIDGFDPSASPDKPKKKQTKAEAAEPDQPTVKVLFSQYSVAADITSSTTKDFTVPGDAAKGPKEPKPSGFIQP